MAKFFKKSNGNYKGNKIPLYVPEPILEDPNSAWRKPDESFLLDPRLRERQSKIYSKIITILTYISIFLCSCIFLGIIKLLFFTNYETTYIDDGTYHTCIIDKQGVVKPYIF